MTATVTVHLVRTAKEYDQAKDHLMALMTEIDSNPDEISAQAQLIEDYERKHFPITAPDAISAVIFRMDQEGLDRSDLARVLKVPRGRVSELLSGKRPFTVAMLRILHSAWRIPSDALLAAVKPSRGKK
jgi:HTH-type transcriptional regulator/antitoxin HigA